MGCFLECLGHTLTLWTISGHSEAGARRDLDTPRVDTPSGALLGTLPGQFGPEGPKRFLYKRAVPSSSRWWNFKNFGLRGPAVILFMLRYTCSDSIAKVFRACFLWGIAQLSRDTLQNGVSHRCARVKLSTKGAYRTIFWGVLTSLKKISRGMGYRSDSIAISRDKGPLRFWEWNVVDSWWRIFYQFFQRRDVSPGAHSGSVIA